MQLLASTIANPTRVPYTYAHTHIHRSVRQLHTCKSGYPSVQSSTQTNILSAAIFWHNGGDGSGYETTLNPLTPKAH